MADHSSMITSDIRRINARALVEVAGSAATFARTTGMPDTQVSQLLGENPTKNIGNKIARRIEAAFHKNDGWLDVPHEEESHISKTIADYLVVAADQTDVDVGVIEYWDAKGSCGGGYLNGDQMPKGHLVKEIGFFNRYGVKPGNLFAVYADGDSMADFIIDGDIVIFDRTKTEPRSGKIFVIEHPDGLRIKQLRRDIDCTWVLESKNADKRAYPDERIDINHLDLLKICGQFVYRQGG